MMKECAGQEYCCHLNHLKALSEGWGEGWKQELFSGLFATLCSFCFLCEEQN